MRDNGSKYDVDDIAYWDENVTLGVDMEADYLEHHADSTLSQVMMWSRLLLPGMWNMQPHILTRVWRRHIIGIRARPLTRT